jgi:hypothetical protein
MGGGVESNWVHSALRSLIGLLCQPRVIMMMENWWNDWQGKPKYSEKSCPSAALSTTNPTCCPDVNPGRRGGKPATNRLSYGTASAPWSNSYPPVKATVDHYTGHDTCLEFFILRTCLTFAQYSTVSWT